MATATQEKREVRIGDYVVTRKIGQGGIAEIYKARQESLNRDVAIKILTSDLSRDPDIVRRFERESLVIARLNHPSIVHVIDKGRAGSRYFFVMEYVDGTSMREVIDSERIALKTKLEMITQVCKALDYAHKNGVIHRDIKPSNILIDRQGNARVADFGIAQIIGTPDSEVTSSDVIMGTLAYMSPEQKISSTNVDQTTDIYALGIIIYEILTGQKPDGRFKLPSELVSDLPRGYDTIVLRCLAQEPMDRYQTAVELKNDLLDVLQGGQTMDDSGDFSVSGSESFVGKCRYLDTIKETKFGSTILVENKQNKRLYVIKKHRKGEAGRKEAKVLASLKHKNVLNILGSGGDLKSTVIICDYAQGGSLADRMVRPYNWAKAMDVILQVAAGLDHAHRNNIVHGNLRPSNILFDSDEVVKLSDFGLPVHYDGPARKNWYSSPEHKTSKQGDIYAMGVILFQMLTNRNPEYDAGGNLWLDDVAQGLPDDVQQMLRKLLAIRVSRRYRSTQEFLLDWDDFDRRRQEEEARRRRRPVQVENKKQQGPPTWVYLAAGLGILGIIAVILVLSGLFG